MNGCIFCSDSTHFTVLLQLCYHFLVIFCLVDLVYVAGYLKVLCIPTMYDDDKMIVLFSWMFVNVHSGECVALLQCKIGNDSFWSY